MLDYFVMLKDSKTRVATSYFTGEAGATRAFWLVQIEAAGEHPLRGDPFHLVVKWGRCTLLGLFEELDFRLYEDR